MPPLNFDFLTLAAVASEFRGAVGARVGRALQPTPHQVILPLRAGPGGTAANGGATRSGPGPAERDLLFCVHPRFARVHFASRAQWPALRRGPQRAAAPAPTEPLPFLSFLRRRLEGARLCAVEQPELERVLRLEFSAVDEVQGLVKLVLVAEVMGKHSNLVLVDESGTVLDALKRVTHRINRYRELLPGRPYLPPPSRPGLDPRSLDRAGLEAAMVAGSPPAARDEGGTGAVPSDAATAAVPGRAILSLTAAHAASLQAWLLDHIQGLSPILAREVAFLAGLDPELPAAALAPAGLAHPLTGLEPEGLARPSDGLGRPADGLDRLHAGLGWLREALRQVLVEGRVQPTGYLDPQGRLLAFSAVPLRQFSGLAALAYPGMSGLLDAFYRDREGRDRLEGARQSLDRRLEALLGRCRRRLALQEEAAASGAEAHKLRQWGELIVANLHAIPAGAASARLRHWDEAGEGGEVEVPLNARLGPAATAQEYFRRYRRLQSTARGASQQARSTREELEYLEETAQFVRQAETLEDLEELGRELARAEGPERPGRAAKGAPGRRATPGRKPVPGRKPGPGRAGARGRPQPATEAPSGPLALTSADGLVMWVGRNSRQNDRITLKDAGPDDVWLHARGLPGSHVILRTLPDGSFPESSLLEAAALAAYFSKGRAAAKVEVDWTRRKHVRKPPGARPGMVIYDHQRSLVVRPVGPGQAGK